MSLPATSLRSIICIIIILSISIIITSISSIPIITTIILSISHPSLGWNREWGWNSEGAGWNQKGKVWKLES